MKVYVASKFENKEAVRAAQRLLREAGHTITHDWTQEDATGKEGAELESYLQRCAEADERAVRECDALVLLNHTGMSGAWVEFGMARAWGKRIIVVGEQPRPIFLAFAEVRRAADVQEVVQMLSAELGSKWAEDQPLSAWQERIHDWAKSKGWWDDATVLPLDARGDLGLIAQKLLLVHSELSEAAEELRKDGMRLSEVYTSDGPKPEGFAIELADAVIRLLDLAEACGIRLEHALATKMAYNEDRPFRHGGKLF